MIKNINFIIVGFGRMGQRYYEILSSWKVKKIHVIDINLKAKKDKYENK